MFDNYTKELNRLQHSPYNPSILEKYQVLRPTTCSSRFRRTHNHAWHPSTNAAAEVDETSNKRTARLGFIFAAYSDEVVTSMTPEIPRVQKYAYTCAPWRQTVTRCRSSHHFYVPNVIKIRHIRISFSPHGRFSLESPTSEKLGVVVFRMPREKSLGNMK